MAPQQHETDGTGPVRDVGSSLTLLQGSLLVLATGVALSFGGLAFRQTDDIRPWEYLVFRGIGAAIVAGSLIAWRHRGRLADELQQVEPIHVAAGALIGTTSCLFIVALDNASVAFVLFGQAAAPITAGYFSWLLMRERVSGRTVVATVGVLVGVTVMVSGSLDDATIEPLGYVALLIPLLFGLYATLVRSATRIDPTVPVVVSGSTMVLVGSVVALASGGFQNSARDAAIGLFAGSMLLGIPLALFNVGQRVVPAPETSLLLMSEVVLAPVWVWLFVDEEPSTATLVGGGVIIAVIAWFTVTRAKPPTPVFTSRG